MKKTKMRKASTAMTLEEQILHAYQHQIGIINSSINKKKSSACNNTNPSGADIDNLVGDEALISDIAFRLMLQNELETTTIAKIDTECCSTGKTQPL